MNIEKIWEDIKNLVLEDQNITIETYNKYVSNSKLIKIKDKNIFIEVENTFSKSIFEGLELKILNYLKESKGIKYNLKIAIKNNLSNEIKPNTQIFNSESKYTFENFVNGDSNNEAFQAAIVTSKNLSEAWNPLFIYGDSGLGKTHLLKAIKNRVYEIYGDSKKSCFLETNKLIKMVIEIIKKGFSEIENFKSSFDKYDLLLIDDIQLLSAKEKSSEIFFTIFNHFISSNKQIVITSDKYPDELGGLENRLISRFKGGLSVGINSPDYETAINILKMKINQNAVSGSIKIDDFTVEAISYIANNFRNDVRTLEGAINKILFWMIMSNKKDDVVKVQDVEQAFKNVPIKIKNNITVKKIINVIADEFGITNRDIIGKKRIKEIALARHLSIYLSKDLLDWSYSLIGIEFNNRDHSTIINSCNVISKKMKEDRKFKSYVNSLIKKMKSLSNK